MNTNIDTYFVEGCGRCPLGGTPQCKVHSWQEPLAELRRILLASGLTEESKWGQPCYTFQDSNVVILGALKESCVLGFFKGVLLKDPAGILIAPGKHSQADRQLCFTDVEQVLALEPSISAYLQEAIEIEKAGLKVEFKQSLEPTPEELQDQFDEDPELLDAFYAFLSRI